VGIRAERWRCAGDRARAERVASVATKRSSARRWHDAGLGDRTGDPVRCCASRRAHRSRSRPRAGGYSASSDLRFAGIALTSRAGPSKAASTPAAASWSCGSKMSRVRGRQELSRTCGAPASGSIDRGVEGQGLRRRMKRTNFKGQSASTAPQGTPVPGSKALRTPGRLQGTRMAGAWVASNHALNFWRSSPPTRAQLVLVTVGPGLQGLGRRAAQLGEDAHRQGGVADEHRHLRARRGSHRPRRSAPSRCAAWSPAATWTATNSARRPQPTIFASSPTSTCSTRSSPPAGRRPLRAPSRQDVGAPRWRGKPSARRAPPGPRRLLSLTHWVGGGVASARAPATPEDTEEDGALALCSALSTAPAKSACADRRLRVGDAADQVACRLAALGIEGGVVVLHRRRSALRSSQPRPRPDHHVSAS